MLCGEGRCLDERFVCDGTPDCGQAEDEVNTMMMVVMWLRGQREGEGGGLGELLQKPRSRTVAVMLEMA